MRAIGWLSSVGPPVLLLLAVAAGMALLPAPLAAGTKIAVSRLGCPAAIDFAGGVSATPRVADVDARLRLSTTLGQRSEVTGRVLTVTTPAGPRTVALAAESFASTPVSNVVIFGEAAADGSTVGAIDLQTGCRYTLLKTQDVVRSAVIDSQLSGLYIHTVSASDRADGGVQRVDLATGARVAVLAPIASSAPFGPTFATLLRWSVDGDALAVQSCGIDACRTRVLTLRTNAVENYADPPHGQLVGLSRTTVVTFDRCPGLPCSLLSIDRRGGPRSDLDVDALAATLGKDNRGAFIDAVTAAGTERLRP